MLHMSQARGKKAWQLRSRIGQKFRGVRSQFMTANGSRIDARALAISVGTGDYGDLRGSHAEAVRLARSGSSDLPHAFQSAARRCAPAPVCDLLAARLALAGRARNQVEPRAFLAVILRQWRGGGTRYADAVPVRRDHQDSIDPRLPRQRLATWRLRILRRTRA